MTRDFPENVLRRSPNIGFNTASADRTKSGTVIPDKHFGGLETGNRTSNLDNCRKYGLSAFLTQTAYFLEDIGIHRAISLTYSLTSTVSVS
jgi:hypothetical protein